MRRENRKHEDEEKFNIKGWKIASFIVAVILLGIAITMSLVGEERSIGEVKHNYINNMTTEEASSEISKTINEVAANVLKSETKIESGGDNEIEKDEEINEIKDSISANSQSTNNKPKNKENKTNEQNTVKNEIKNEIKEDDKKEKNNEFIFPVEKGEIIAEFAKDNLIYSDTLEEWITHPGIDIKADKTSVVKATAKGKVKSIKNDPRYGLTVTIEHDNGYMSSYSSLLSTEFIKEGEEVKQGQTIATVGNSAVFEVAQGSHLHFELYKNGTTINPEMYLK